MNLSIIKTEIIVLKEKASDILEELQKLGTVEIIKNKKELDSSSDFFIKKEEAESMLANLKFARSFLSNFQKKENFISNFINSFIPNKLKLSLEDFNKLLKSEDINQAIKQSSELEEEINQLKLKVEKTSREIKSIDVFLGINTNFKSFYNLKNFNCFLGLVKKENKDNILKELDQKKIPYSMQWGKGIHNSISFLLIYPKHKEVLFDQIIKDYDIKKEEINLRESPEKEIQNRKQEIEKDQELISLKTKQTEKLSLIIPKIEALIDWFEWEFEKYYFLESTQNTKKFIFINAWIVKKSIPEIKKIIEKISPVYFMKELFIGKDEKVPVIINNKGIIKSFEAVTRIYGLPQSDELDPTPFLAPFFALFFGIVLSDVGYGLLLAIFSLLAKNKLKGRGVDSFFNLLILAGVFTFIAGIFTGTFFGTDIFSGLRLMDPMADPVKFLVFIFILGLVQIIIGLIISIIWNIKNKNFNEAIGQKLSSIVLILSIILGVIFSNTIIIISGFILSFLLSAIFCINKKFILRISSGLGSLYGLIGYLSDVLSYSRLLALGLATGVIAMVINIIADIFKDMIPVFGFVVAGIILVFGHFFNLIINTLSAFIHSARLQFVEFFSKFMKGGGSYFRPLSKQGRFVEIINHNSHNWDK